MPARYSRLWLLVIIAVSLPAGLRADKRDETAYFEAKIRPLLAAHCYECHSAKKGKLSGGLALDTKAGWTTGGDGGPAIIPGKPQDSRLIEAIGWRDEDLRMPPKKKLDDAQIALVTEWVRRGAHDPRTEPHAAAAPAADSWEATYRSRLDWWSLKPLADSPIPAVKNREWGRNAVDRFILAGLERAGLTPVAEADRAALVRRASFALTGLPPSPEEIESVERDTRPTWFEAHVDRLLASPHFGEHWARRWMDVVHYADTHGYEWDLPAKNGWRYRDYLIRAANDDVPFQQMIIEQIAGDLAPAPRIDRETGWNESLIGPMALRLGERRHGDNGEFDGITQEAIDNVIDTIGKAYLGTTVACAHCHDHKLDAIAQRDYYAWAGVFMSSRYVARSLQAETVNDDPIVRLAALKKQLRAEFAARWQAAIAANAVQPPSANPQETQSDPWHVVRQLAAAGEDPAAIGATWKRLGTEYSQLGAARKQANGSREILADFTGEKIPSGWSIDGLGFRDGRAKDGDFAVHETGPAIIRHLLPAGRYTHLYSARLQGAIRSPTWSPSVGFFSIDMLGGGLSSGRAIFDHAFFPEQAAFFDLPYPGTHAAHSRMSAEFKNRRIYYELVTRDLNNNYPARVGLIKETPEQAADDRSWFGVSQVYSGPPREDELARFVPLFQGNGPQSSADWRARVRTWLSASVARWRNDAANTDDVMLINWMLKSSLVPNDAPTGPLKALVDNYRANQAEIEPDVTVGSIAEDHEGRDERLGIRGSYDDFGAAVPRGNIGILSAVGSGSVSNGSGRLQLAQSIADPRNPLTARVYVNRVWKALFGEGLVRTVDDFGHLGEKPSHPELLDHLAREFMADNWSTKRLIRKLVTSATWRQSSARDPRSWAADPENRLRHHFPLQRLEAEAIRDAVLAVSGRFDPQCFGPAIDPHRASEDPMKRLFSGPLDGRGRRSIYIKMTLMEPPRFLGEFNQPIPKQTVGKRDVTNVPGQALTLLNDPFVIAQASAWASRLIAEPAATAEDRVSAMMIAALGRSPSRPEIDRLVGYVKKDGMLRGVPEDKLLASVDVWKDVAHAIFNLKEFIYLR